MPFALALILALDQRIELQLPLLLALTAVVVLRVKGVVWRPGTAAAALALAAAYLATNAVITFTDPTGVADSWWAAPVRIWVFYLLLIALATSLSAPSHDGETMFRTLEWLFLLKLLVIAFEGVHLLQTGEPRERPLFNIILSADSLIGARFTSSYDMLFALLALSARRQHLRLLIVAAALVITETRALLLLSALMLAWRLVRDRSAFSLMAAVLIPVLGAVGAITVLLAEQDNTPRLAQISGSSLDDKIEQIDVVSDLILSPYLLTGRGLGASLPGIVRDDARPYSYEAQTPVLLWQGGLMFFALHLFMLWLYGGRHRLIAIVLVLLLGVLNPTLFGLSSAFFTVAFGRVFDRPHASRPDAHRHPAVHA
jgi:hypothetical protein